VKLSRGLVAALAAASLVFGAVGGIAIAYVWHVVSQRSTSADFAVTATHATIAHPHAIAVRMAGGSGLAIWACTKGFRVSSWSRNYGRGLHQLPHVSGKDSCDVTASVSGQGHVSVQILRG
jgi:hypothetical protein